MRPKKQQNPHSPLLQTPPDQNLPHLHPMLLCNLDQHRITESLLIRPDQWAVSLHGNTVLLAVGDDIALLTPWVELYLVDGGCGGWEGGEVGDAAGVLVRVQDRRK